MRDIKIGFIGAGHISNSMSIAINNIEGIEKYAIASRNIDKARKFAKDHNFKKSYGSYEEMLNDNKVELVYVATPVSYHYEHVKKSLEYGKHVLCEKTFTSTYKEAKELISISKKNNLLLADAIWTRYMPSRYKIEEIINSKIIGIPKILEANLGYILTDRPRLFSKELSGGSLYELGIYPLNLSLIILGNKIKSVNVQSIIDDNGIDLQSCVTLKYNNDVISNLIYSINSITDSRAVVAGTEGYIVIENVNNPQNIYVYSKERKLLESYSKNDGIKGYEYQLKSVIEAINNGMIECKDMTHIDILEEMELVDIIAEQNRISIT
ncbi:Gfo/Idh/MocA family oxidoreductase [Brachyspira sp.]|uniref:Gfo/Idh/MocA family protein n=1 Tax=Brachyspira sp. TaxID=1977261 RepID=UPI002612CA5B|nr:Gfo/Idh/MocA family oxidoreductase [Brachyspira sp.]